MKYFIQTGFDAEIGDSHTVCFVVFVNSHVSKIQIMYIGCLTFKSLFLPNPSVSEVEKVAQTLSDSTPAFYSITKSKLKYISLLRIMFHKLQYITEAGGVSADEEFTHGNLLKHSSLWFAKNFIEKKYFEC